MVFLCTPSISFAAVTISEIMYDLPGVDTGREWVEIYNSGTGDALIATSTWKFFEANTNHGLILVRGSATLPAGGAAVIADDSQKFLVDWSSFSGTLFTSSFSLSNTGEILAIKSDTSTVTDQTAYDVALGGAGDGNSLQKLGGSWTAAAPTPGVVASGGSQPPSGGGSDSTDSGATSTPPVEETRKPPTPEPQGGSQSGSIPWVFEQRIFVSAKAPTKAVAGADTSFEAFAVGLKKEPLQNARYVWSFGDGASLEGKRVYHAYHYPGSYIVVVDASSGEWAAMDRKEITVSAPLLAVSDIAEGPEGFIELTNSGKEDIDLSRWFLKAGANFFTFPNGTIIKGGNTIPFSAEITKLAAAPSDTALLYPNGKTVARYAAPAATHEPEVIPLPSAPIEIEIPAPLQKQTEPVSKETEDTKTTTPAVEEPRDEEPAKLQAAVSASDAGGSMWFLSALAVSMVAAGGYLFVARRLGGVKPPGELSAKDFDIVE